MFRRQLIIDRPLTSTSGVICVEMMRSFDRAGARFVEIPVHHYFRPSGKSQFFRLPAIARSAWQLLRAVVAHGDPWTLRPERATPRPGHVPTMARVGLSAPLCALRMMVLLPRRAASVVHPRRLGVHVHPRRRSIRSVGSTTCCYGPGRALDDLSDPRLSFDTRLFGTGSYWPYLIPAMACHLGIAVMVRRSEPACRCRRRGRPRSSPECWPCSAAGGRTSCSPSRSSYNLSLLAFLVQLSLIDHDGPPDRRDAFGVVAGSLPWPRRVSDRSSSSARCSSW